MGKDLKGKELGSGLSQRKDGLYTARYTTKAGKRLQSYSPKLSECVNWLTNTRYEDQHEAVFIPTEMTVDEWFEYWINHIVGDLAPNTRRNYTERYKQNIQPIIGEMKLAEVKPLYCKMVLNQMDKDYAGSTIRQTYIAMGTMFKSALMNDLIAKHPMNGVRYTKPIRAVNDIKFLTIEEQRIFLETAARSHNYNQYALILETGVRTGEMIGLTWDSIDWNRRTLTVSKTLEYRHKQGCWRAGPPKTQQSYRTIPLTNRAYEILKDIYSKKNERKQSETLSQTLEYIDRLSGKKATLVMKDLVFINWRTGEPAKNSSY